MTKILNVEERKILEPFISNLDSEVYVPRNLQGIVGAVMARLSRAKGSFFDGFLCLFF